MEKNDSQFTTHNLQFNQIAIFQKKEIRKTIHNDEWWFVINDVIAALTDSKDPAQYFKRIKTGDEELKKLNEEGLVQFVPPLRLDIEVTVRNFRTVQTEGSRAVSRDDQQKYQRLINE